VPIVFALFLGYLFIKDVFCRGSASLKPFLASLLATIYSIPALSMRSISGRKNG